VWHCVTLGQILSVDDESHCGQTGVPTAGGVTIGSSLSLARWIRLGSSLTVSETGCLGSSLSVRNFARVGGARIGNGFVTVKSSLSTRMWFLLCRIITEYGSPSHSGGMHPSQVTLLWSPEYLQLLPHHSIPV
jgi:hypothetical protein